MEIQNYGYIVNSLYVFYKIVQKLDITVLIQSKRRTEKLAPFIYNFIILQQNSSKPLQSGIVFAMYIPDGERNNPGFPLNIWFQTIILGIPGWLDIL
jgi:hypothetical protein